MLSRDDVAQAWRGVVLRSDVLAEGTETLIRTNPEGTAFRSDVLGQARSYCDRFEVDIVSNVPNHWLDGAACGTEMAISIESVRDSIFRVLAIDPR